MLMVQVLLNYYKGEKMGKIIQEDKSIIPACDLPLDVYANIMRATGDILGVGGYKIGPALTGRPGYDQVVRITREFTDKPLIFDGQKWGTDIPDTAGKMLTPLRESGIDAVILFPLAGPATEYAWVTEAQELGLGVIVGGEMTHPRFGADDFRNGKDIDYTRIFEDLLGVDVSGWIDQHSMDTMYILAAALGVENFVMPGNKPSQIERYRGLVTDHGIALPSVWSPGLVKQLGKVSEATVAAGDSFHGIVGRGIYAREDGSFKSVGEMRDSALELVAQL